MFVAKSIGANWSIAAEKPTAAGYKEDTWPVLVDEDGQWVSIFLFVSTCFFLSELFLHFLSDSKSYACMCVIYNTSISDSLHFVRKVGFIVNAVVQAKAIIFLCILDFAMRGAHRFVPRIAKEGFDMGKTNVALKAANVTLVFTRPLYVSFTPV